MKIKILALSVLGIALGVESFATQGMTDIQLSDVVKRFKFHKTDLTFAQAQALRKVFGSRKITRGDAKKVQNTIAEAGLGAGGGTSISSTHPPLPVSIGVRGGGGGGDSAAITPRSSGVAATRSRILKKLPAPPEGLPTDPRFRPLDVGEPEVKGTDAVSAKSLGVSNEKRSQEFKRPHMHKLLDFLTRNNIRIPLNTWKKGSDQFDKETLDRIVELQKRRSSLDPAEIRKELFALTLLDRGMLYVNGDYLPKEIEKDQAQLKKFLREVIDNPRRQKPVVHYALPERVWISSKRLGEMTPHQFDSYVSKHGIVMDSKSFAELKRSFQRYKLTNIKEASAVTI